MKLRILKVKWLGGCSDCFSVKQDTRQGGILSTHLYKVYISPLLDTVRNKRLGLLLGTVYIGDPTVADDFVCLTKSRKEL